MGALPGTPPTGAALKAASVGGGPEVAAAAKSARSHRQQIDGIKSRRKPPPAAPPAAPPPGPPAGPPTAAPQGGPPAAFTDQRGAPGWYQKATSPDPVAMGNAGGGFLLGVALWAVGLAYLRGGPTAVRQLLAAKFLNRPAVAS